MELALTTITQVLLSGAAFSFVIGLLKWIDERRREREERQYQSFHRMICLASGTDETGRIIKLPQQLAAIYQLQRFKEYAFASVPVLQVLLDDVGAAEDPRASHLTRALQDTIVKLSPRGAPKPALREAGP